MPAERRQAPRGEPVYAMAAVMREVWERVRSTPFVKRLDSIPLWTRTRTHHIRVMI